MVFRLALLWLGIAFLVLFRLSLGGAPGPVSLAVLPQVPREGEPIIATFKLNNPSSQVMVTRYQFYTNGELLKEGAATIAPGAGKTYQYAYRNPLHLGEQLNFLLQTQSAQGDYQRVLALPQYPPQIWSSFVSFASFSTSVMSSMSTMVYYQDSFGSDTGFNVGLLSLLVLTALLIFLELTPPVLQGYGVTLLARLRIRFSTVTWILFVIFSGMVYTRMWVILTT